MTEPMTAEERAAWEAASEQDRLRSSVSVAELVEQDMADPETPDHFDIELTPFDRLFMEANSIDPEHARPRAPLGAGQSWNVTAMQKVAALLRSWGWTVLESPGWQTRGVAGIELRADYTVVHHTAAAVDVDRILRDGRSDLSGPLCNFAVHLNSDIVLMAAGKANHAGVATIGGEKSWGIESTGPVPVSGKGVAAFPNYRAQVALCVAIRIVEGWGPERTRAHKEIALPAGRKPDPAFGSVYPGPYADMNTFRSQLAVTQVLKNPTPPKEPDVPLTPADGQTVLNTPIEIPATYQKEYARKVYSAEEIIFSAQYHSQEAHQKIATILATVQASAAREAAMLVALDTLSKALAAATAGDTGLEVSKEELQAMMDSAAMKAVEDLDLDVVLVKEPPQIPTP